MVLYPKEQLLTTITIPYKCFLFLQEVHFGARNKGFNVASLVTE